MADGQRVLLIDGLSETETVLRAVLEPRGHQVQRVRWQDSPDAHGGNGRPNVLVVHEEATPAAPRTRSHWPNVPRIIIGSTEGADSGEQEGAHRLQFPFHYRELVQAIERLLTDSRS